MRASGKSAKFAIYIFSNAKQILAHSSCKIRVKYSAADMNSAGVWESHAESAFRHAHAANFKDE